MTGNTRKAILFLSLFFALSFTVHGQSLSIGFIGGTNITHDFPATNTERFAVDPFTGQPETEAVYQYSDTHHFIAGLSVEALFGKGFSLEADALHRSFTLQSKYTYANGMAQTYGNTVRSWEFPLLLKYRFAALHGGQPFVEAGPSFRTSNADCCVQPSVFGGTVGAGIEFRTGFLHIAPMLRYTRWRYDGSSPIVATKADQFEFLVNFSFRALPWNGS